MTCQADAAPTEPSGSSPDPLRGVSHPSRMTSPTPSNIKFDRIDKISSSSRGNSPPRQNPPRAGGSQPLQVSQLGEASTSSIIPFPPSNSHKRLGKSTGKASKKKKSSFSRKLRYPCPECPKSFGRRHDFDRHWQSSCTMNPEIAVLECPDCKRTFSRPDSLKRHERSLHG